MKNKRMRLGTRHAFAYKDDILKSDEIAFAAPLTGLADRLNVVGPLLALCKILKKKPRLYWVVNDACNGKFTDLYCPNFHCTHFNAGDAALYGTDAFGRTTFEFKPGADPGTIYPLICNLLPKTSKVDTSAFVELSKESLRTLPLQEAIQKRISAVQKEAWQYIPIGIHIRRTDKIISAGTRKSHEIDANGLQNVDMQSFKLIEKHCKKDTHFFLASDNEAYVKKIRDFVEARGCHLHTSGNVFNETSLRQTSLDCAFVDMQLLARCKRVLLCGPSAFGRLAATIGDIPSEEVFTQNAYIRSFERWKNRTKLLLLKNLRLKW